MSERVVQTKFIIYGLSDPRTGELRYVGKSVSGLHRAREHSCPSRLRGNSRKVNWIKSLNAISLKPDSFIIETLKSIDDLYPSEKFYIEYFRYLGCNLTNHTDGGPGSLGMHHSEKTKEILSKKLKIVMNTPEAKNRSSALSKERWKDKDYRSNMIKLRSGHVHLEESKRKIGLANKGRTISADHKGKISAARMGRKLTEEHKRKIAASRKGQRLTAEHRLRISTANRMYWESKK